MVSSLAKVQNKLISGKQSVQAKITKIYKQLRKDAIQNEFRGCHFHNLMSKVSSP